MIKQRNKLVATGERVTCEDCRGSGTVDSREGFTTLSSICGGCFGVGSVLVFLEWDRERLQ